LAVAVAATVIVTLGGCAAGGGPATGAGAGAGSGTAAGAGAAAGSSAEATFRLDDALEREISPFDVVGQDGVPYEFAFLGGFDVPRPQFVDIDGDGTLDLFLQTYRGELMFFENTGTPASPRFEWRTSNYQELDVGEWARFFDLEGNGLHDLFMEMPSSYIRYARNVGTLQEARFELSEDSVRNPEGRPIFSDAQNIPSLVDIDCNGRPDLFLGRIDGTLARYEFVEFSGGQPVFERVTERFENIEIIGVLGIPGGPLPSPSPPGTLHQPTLHGANSMAFGDWNGNGAPDLFWGDFFEPGLLLIRNIGTCPRPNLDVEPVPVPADPPISTSGYNAPALADLNDDGHMDLVIGVLGGAYNPNRTAVDNLHFYRGQPDGTFVLETRRFLYGLDLGSEAVPAFGDLTGNGAPDLLIGSKLDPATSLPPPLHWYENVGTRTAPRFVFRATLPEVAHLNGAPVLVDLNGDGLLDLLVGTFNENIRYYRNVGTAEAPRFEAAGSEPIARIPRGSYTAPTVGDLTGNGLQDLVVGQSSGALNLFLNTGTRAEPRFELVPDGLAGINVGSRSSPLLVDLDGDGTLDLLVGEETGQLLVFWNVGTPTEPRFTAEAQRIPGRFPRLAAPRLVDLDGNGALDLVLGDQGGGLVYFRNAGARSGRR
jgi:hypothetical protein